MKNRYVKCSHLSVRKVRQIIKLFSADLTATQMAELTRVNRNTINRLMQLLRQRLVWLAEAESCFTAGEIEVDESYFGARRVRGGVARQAKPWCLA